MTKTVDELMALAVEACRSSIAGFALQALRTAIEQALAEAREAGESYGFNLADVMKLEQAQQVREPVAVVYQLAQGTFAITCVGTVFAGMKLYAGPTKAKPAPELTDEEVWSIYRTSALTGKEGVLLNFARAVLKAQKEKQT